MKRNNFFKIIFFIALLVPTITIVNTLAWVLDPPGDDSTPPTASWISPASGATVSGSVNMIVSATDDDSGVAYVDFYVGSSYIGRDSVPTSGNQYSRYFNSELFSDGGYSLKAWVIDNNGNYISKYRSIIIDNDADSTDPIVFFTSPASCATVSRDVTITVTATDSDSGMKHVDFYIDDSYLGRDDDTSDSHFSFTFDSWEYTRMFHGLKARAYDNENNFADEYRDIIIDNDPVKLAYPTEGPYWHTDAARHPTDANVYGIARKATGYGMRKLGLDGNTEYNIVRGIARFAKDWLEPTWDGDGNAKNDRFTAGFFSAFDSSYDVGDITITKTFDCRDITAFVTGMAMAMGIQAKVISCEFTNDFRHMASLLYDGNEWFLISVYDGEGSTTGYVDSNSDPDDVRSHLGGTDQYVFHFLYYLDVWDSGNYDKSELDETGWVGWLKWIPMDHWFDDDEHLRYHAPDFWTRIDFVYWEGNPWGITVSQDRRDWYYTYRYMIIHDYTS